MPDSSAPPSGSRWERAIAEVETAPAATARLVTALEPPRSLAVVPGAYNPPTRAHVALADAARARGFDAAVFALGTQTIDKMPSGLALAERLELLAEIAAADATLGVVLHNRGLYAEQAEAVRRLFPDVDRLAFVVGMDKIAQIFDARYYDDFEDSLAALFARARLLVAARGPLDRAALERSLERPAAKRFADAIDWVEIDPSWRELSASAVRERLARGESAADWLPEVVERRLRGRAVKW